MATIESKPLPLPNALPITEADRQRLHDAIGGALKDVLSGPQSYYPDGVQEDSQDMGDDLDRFITSLENFKNNYVIDPSDVMGPMVDQLKERVKEFKKFHEDKTNDPMELRLDKFPPFTFTRDNRVIHVSPFPGPYEPPNPVRQRPPYYDASTQTSGSTNDGGSVVSTYPQLSSGFTGSSLASNSRLAQSDNLTNVDRPLGIYSGKPMKQWIVPPPIWRTR